MKIYIVTSGEYSDYGICSVHETKEDAEKGLDLAKIRSSYSADSARIQEWDTGVTSTTIEEKAIDQGKSFFAIYDQKNREVCCFGVDSDEVNEDLNKVERITDDQLHCYVMARDKDHALKIYYDLLTQYKAREAGL